MIFANHLRGLTAACLIVFATANVSAGPLVAFDGAEGFGALATGGRDGEIVHVKNLDDSGPGSLRDAVSTPNRFVVFDVGGVITLQSELLISSNITLAGQSAPGDGITVYGRGVSLSKQNNIIVRYIRFRSSINSPKGEKTFNIAGGNNIIVDHVSISWGRWDDLGITKDSPHGNVESHDITIQNCLIGEPIDPQKFGALIDVARNITIAKNLWIDCQSRNPKGEADMQYIDNVIYNWGSNGYGGSHSTGGLWHQDLINNLFIAGPSSHPENALTLFTFNDGKGDSIYHTGNIVNIDHNGDLHHRLVEDKDFKGSTPDDVPEFRKTPFCKPVVRVKISSAGAAFAHVMAQAGDTFPRDSIDERLIRQAASFGTSGAIIASEAEVGGINKLDGGPLPLDSDSDGIPDTWEKNNGLNPNNPADAAAVNGYSNLENYLNAMLENPRAPSDLQKSQIAPTPTSNP